MISKPIQVKAIFPYSIWLKYDDNTEGEVDLSHLLNKPVFQNWKKNGFFDKVHINDETDAIAWDENIELCPDNLYLKIKGISTKLNYWTIGSWLKMVRQLRRFHL